MIMKTQTIYVGTCLPASVDVIWEKLQRIDTLQYIAAPYATFKPVGDTALVWIEGSMAKFNLKLFGFISLGVHTIFVKQFDKNTFVISTSESNKFVPVWNHRIVLQKTDNNTVSFKNMDKKLSRSHSFCGWQTFFIHTSDKKKYKGICNYSDEVELFAGWKTPIVALWCKLFYKHRQKKWLKLLP